MVRKKFRAILFHDVKYIKALGVWYCCNIYISTNGRTKAEARAKLSKLMRAEYKAYKKYYDEVGRG